ncbi:asparaginyl-tRNA synthetase [Tilletiaria anomala UBC 951]|uniref:asparagine--tRNA ligase n=1 Tax=Tilletiaria anomala (strain ATCC 24038 / CBS 436.72 / UBC 951) TaxID=1037660 RepID=A0A066VPF4_TILAU|nr:asparaginyl-tRNA synthetase [Tilletiaria anomala UBC 951]KDN43326.1 asparaginyl-tRNA synthetase [Tilletiaria anomala UBC 951]
MAARHEALKPFLRGQWSASARRTASIRPGPAILSSLRNAHAFTTAPDQSQQRSIRLPRTLRQAVDQVEQGRHSGEEQEITVKGWIKSVRKHAKITFIDLDDGTLLGGQTLQTVLKGSAKDVIDATWTVGAAVQLVGTLISARPSQGSPGPSSKPKLIELVVSEGRLLAPCDSAVYPLNTFPSVETLRQAAHLRFRRSRDAAVLRARDRIEAGIAQWFTRNDFTKVTAPVITSSDCEGAGEVFQVIADAELADSRELGRAPSYAFWSGSPAYLTVSSQLHLEALSLALSRVWSFTPAFRAEHSATNRHLAEFRMCEAEMAFTDSLGDVLDCVQGVVEAAVRSAVLANGTHAAHPDAATLFDRDDFGAHLRALVQSGDDSAPWPRISYTEAVDRVNRHFNTSSLSWGDSLSSEQERWLASEIGQGPLFVTDYPASMKPFYMRLNDAKAAGATGPTVACFDLLIPGLGELAGGSLREEREEVLLEQMRGKGLVSASTQEHLRWYAQDLRRYGGVAHGGFGIGVERLVSWITATDNVRDCVPFARTQGPVRF